MLFREIASGDMLPLFFAKMWNTRKNGSRATFFAPTIAFFPPEFVVASGKIGGDSELISAAMPQFYFYDCLHAKSLEINYTTTVQYPPSKEGRSKFLLANCGKWRDARVFFFFSFFCVHVWRVWEGEVCNRYSWRVSPPFAALTLVASSVTLPPPSSVFWGTSVCLYLVNLEREEETEAASRWRLLIEMKSSVRYWYPSNVCYTHWVSSPKQNEEAPLGKLL